MHACFVFLDGVGLGPPGPANPLDADLPAFARLAGGQRWTNAAQVVEAPGHVFRPLDATLGVDGLPQSGTGQTALFAGVNAPQMAGRHYGPTPHSATHAALAAHNVFQRALDAGIPPERLAFLNAYPDRFFGYAESTGRWSTTTRMARAAGVRLRTEADVRAGVALTAEVTGQAWRERLGLDVPVLTPEAAGARLHALGRAHTLVVFEFFLTDKAGHARDADTARSVLATADALLAGYLAGFDATRDLLVVSSDHGNLEDLGVKTHTRHPVPLVALGLGTDAFARAASLVDVAPALADALRQNA